MENNLKLNEEYIVKIINTDNKGNGIARINDFVIFIKGVFINEEVKIKITRIEKRYAIGELINVILKDKNRKEIICPKFYECGGCNFLHLEIEKELICKKELLNNLFPNETKEEIINVNEYHYRNKVTFHVRDNKLGYFKEKSNELVEIKECFLLDKDITKLVNFIKSFDLSNITEVMIRKVFNDNELMVKFNGKLNDKDLISLLSYKNLGSVYENDTFVYGKEYLKEIINNKIYTIYPKSFFQVNTTAMEKLYQTIKDNIKEEGTLLDLYSGTGTIALYLSDKFDSVLGIEIIKDAIKNANLNKKLNKIENVSFMHLDSSKIKDKKADVIIVDPPRAGLSKIVVNNIIKMRPKELIYVSCNPLTLKRDLDLLKKDFAINKMIPINMFPKTEHIECVVLLN